MLLRENNQKSKLHKLLKNELKATSNDSSIHL